MDMVPNAPSGVAMRLYDNFTRSVGVILAVILGVMSVLISYQVIARYFFNAPSSLTEELLRYLLIWLGVLGAAYCFMLNRHLNLPLLIDALGPHGAGRLNLFNACLTLLFGALLAWGGYHSMIGNAAMKTPMLHVSVGALQSVLLLSGLLICLSQCVLIGELLRSRAARVYDLAGIVLIVVVLIALGGLFRGTLTYQNWVDDHIELFSILILFGTLFALLILGTSIAVGLAFSGLLTLSLQIDMGSLFSTMGEKLFNGLDSFGFLALPFFVLAGNIMNQAGIARRLIDFAMLLGRRIPGSLWQTNTIANMLFGSLSGSGIAAATAIGGIVTPIAREEKYDMPITTAVNAASAPAGMLIPPSGALIVYSLITGGSASIVALFLAGYVPGIIMGVSVMAVAWFYAKKRRMASDRTPYRMDEVAGAFMRAFPSLLLVIIVIGGIILGVFTATEGSGIAVLYSVILALFYRSLSPRALLRVLVETAAATGVILFLIACSNLMSWSMTFASIPDTIGEMLTSLSSNKYVILLLINAALLVVGVFMDMSPAQLIFTPIFYPVVTALGVDPVHFGVVMVYNLAMGVVTPPVGTVLFVSCSVSGEKITKVVRPLLPIFAVQIIGLLLITFIPALSLTLPRLFGV
ncbi:TRAP transporter large permease subunit [Martelella sp. HB161492]|uniref:TRAP transporter large permease n=1 Tax=Martelella sp. HB161492 TaxID=2720726 RepID=UPI001AEF03DA|nr:TRAP transporter large permease subunit [Martelella sp. HB161492]